MNPLDKAKNAILDLQNSNAQTFQRPLRSLADALADNELSKINEELLTKADLEEFLESASGRHGIGAQPLEWPSEQSLQLSLFLQLVEKFSQNPDFLIEFGYEYLTNSPKFDDHLSAVVRHVLLPFWRDYTAYAESFLSAEEEGQAISNYASSSQRPYSNEVFIVHGRDEAPREAVARFIEKLGMKPIILQEQADQGDTIIEKIQRHTNVGFAVVLMTPDDVGRLLADEENQLKPRARQNVLIELGYFVALLGRRRVCIFRKGDVDIPTDFAGVIWKPYDERDAWKRGLATELEAAGYPVDWNRVMRN